MALIEWGGLGYAETAVALGIPVGTVRSRAARSRSRLEEAIDAGAPADDSLLLPGDCTLEARRPALEACCSRRSFSVLAL